MEVPKIPHAPLGRVWYLQNAKLQTPSTTIKRGLNRAMSWNPLGHYAIMSYWRREKIFVPPAMRLSLPSLPGGLGISALLH